ncbi:hypothetical protein [Rhodococcus sp. NPDC127528]|uniref:hypothetical protein n=1 Tax=unclassified Rhodococcus (in: high G+C Gram-positive bacteria) TaxID=192944 RepID=UPI00363D8974
MGEAVESWVQLANSVESGQLYLERGVAQLCSRRCAELVANLKDIQLDVQGLNKVVGLGPLPSGVALSVKFEKKAIGGDYSLDQAIADHIRTVEQMQHVFEQIEARYAATDTAAARGIESSGAGLTDRGN